METHTSQSLVRIAVSFFSALPTSAFIDAVVHESCDAGQASHVHETAYTRTSSGSYVGYESHLLVILQAVVSYRVS